MKYHVTHTTRYDYSEIVPMCYNQAHLTPRTSERQRLLSTAFEVAPVPAVFGRSRQDYFGNQVTYFTVQEPHTTLSVVVASDVELVPEPQPEASSSLPWEAVREALRRPRDADELSAYQYCFDSYFVRAGGDLERYALPSFPAGRPVLEGVLDLTRRIHAEFTYDTAATTVSTPLEQVMREKRGVCQDFAHLGIGGLRALGLAARYVSGYLFGGDRAEAQHLTGGWASHAWLSVYVPGAGWVDIDPTNNMVASLEHITLAWGHDYDDVSPVRGVVLGGGEHTLTVAVDIARAS